MIAKVIPIAVFAAVLGAALNAGIFYAFTSFIMAGLGRVTTSEGVNAMNAINVTVITPSFMIVFMGTTLLCVALAIWSLTSLGDPHAWLVLAASLVFVIGCFGVTMVFNVPLNDRLAAVSGPEAEGLWRTYLSVWTRWNTVRTAAPLISLALFVLALWRR